MKNLNNFLSSSPFKNIAEHAEKEYIKNNKKSLFKSHFHIYGMSLWFGNLLPTEQRRKAKELGLSDASFTKYNTTLGYLTILITEHSLPFLYTQSSTNKTDDTIFWINLGTGVAVNATRAIYAFVKEKPSPGIGVISLGINLLHYSKKAVETLVKNKKRD